MIVIDLITAASPVAETSGGADWWESAIVAAIVAAAVSVMTFGLTGRRARIDRQRQVFADAFESVMDYREYPFIVRRRDPDEPANERQRISSDLSKVQARLNGYKARLLVEDVRVGNVTDLVNETRRVAGSMIRDAWTARRSQTTPRSTRRSSTSASFAVRTMPTSRRSPNICRGSRGSGGSGVRVGVVRSLAVRAGDDASPAAAKRTPFRDLRATGLRGGGFRSCARETLGRERTPTSATR